LVLIPKKNGLKVVL